MITKPAQDKTTLGTILGPRTRVIRHPDARYSALILGFQCNEEGRFETVIESCVGRLKSVILADHPEGPGLGTGSTLSLTQLLQLASDVAIELPVTDPPNPLETSSAPLAILSPDLDEAADSEEGYRALVGALRISVQATEHDVPKGLLALILIN
jgi:hypothetical protein